MFTVELPWPPSVNHYWRTITVRMKNANLRARMGMKYEMPKPIISMAGRKYRARAQILLRAAMWDHRTEFDQWPLKGDLEAHLTVHPPDRRARDLDNLPKAIFDAFTHALVWTDDRQIAHFSVTRADVVEGGKVIIRVALRP